MSLYNDTLAVVRLVVAHSQVYTALQSQKAVLAYL